MIRRSISLFVAVCFLGAPLAAPQKPTPSPVTTGGMNNGRFWLEMQGEMKLGYLLGYIDGVHATSVTLAAGCPDVKRLRLLPHTLSSVEIAEALDEFYNDPLNRQIGIVFAITATARKAEGATSAEMDQMISEFRKAASATKTAK